MLFARLLTYGALLLIGTALISDTNMGSRLDYLELAITSEAIGVLNDTGFDKDAGLANDILESQHFRESRFFGALSRIASARGSSFGYYAYTPVLSRRSIFLGDAFWETDDAGRASIVIHELAHVGLHRKHVLGGFRRSADEAEAYRRQYDTHEAVGVSAYEAGSDVYWDMMLGVTKYVLPRYPQYAENPDVRTAVRLYSQTEEEPAVLDYARALLYVCGAFVLMLAGDRAGLFLACAVLKRCTRTPLLHLSPWMLPVVILLPSTVLAIYGVALLKGYSGGVMEILMVHLYAVILTLFFLSGLIGGFLCGGSHTNRPSEAVSEGH